MAALVRHLDADNDSRISVSELEKALETEMFKKAVEVQMSNPVSGVLEKIMCAMELKELTAASMARAIDINGDGEVSTEELDTGANTHTCMHARANAHTHKKESRHTRVRQKSLCMCTRVLLHACA